mgnify:FL=1
MRRLAGGLDPAELWRVGTFSTGGIEPDLTLILDLSVEASMARRKPGADRMESRGDAFFARVRAGFLAEAARRPERHRVIDATPAVDIVQESLRREIATFLQAPR